MKRWCSRDAADKLGSLCQPPYFVAPFAHRVAPFVSDSGVVVRAHYEHEDRFNSRHIQNPVTSFH